MELVSVSDPTCVVLSAPQGLGKSTKARELACILGCTHIVDEWDGLSLVPKGSLVLTNTPFRPSNA